MASSADLAQALVDLGRQIKRRRADLGLSRNGAAREIGCSAATLERLEAQTDLRGVHVSTALRALRWMAGDEAPA